MCRNFRFKTGVLKGVSSNAGYPDGVWVDGRTSNLLMGLASPVQM